MMKHMSSVLQKPQISLLFLRIVRPGFWRNFIHADVHEASREELQNLGEHRREEAIRHRGLDVQHVATETSEFQ